MNGVQGQRSDGRPRCESCRRPIMGVVFRMYWRDEVFFDVCEQCSPVPGEDILRVESIDWRKQKERDMEQSD
jgi:hypothetical protein